MKKQTIFLTFFLCWFFVAFAQEETNTESKPAQAKLDPKLDPMYFVINRNDIIAKRSGALRQRKGDVPEQLWKIKTDGVVTAPPIALFDRIVLGTSMGRGYYVDKNTGKQVGNSAGSGAPIIYLGMYANDRYMSVTWVGTVGMVTMEWEHLAQSAIGAYKGNSIHPLGGLFWMRGCIVTQRDELPVLVDVKDGKVSGKLSNKWENGEATTPTLFMNDAFCLGTSRGDLLIIDGRFTKIQSMVRVKKSYATALAYENNHVYALTAEGELYAFDYVSGIQQWVVQLAEAGVDSMICDNGQIFVNAGKFYVIKADTGRILEDRDTLAHEKFKRTKPIVTKDRIFTCDSDGTIFIFNRQNFKLIQAINLEEDVMVNFAYLENVLYVPTIFGNLYAIDTSWY